jgi:hypothetical protein
MGLSAGSSVALVLVMGDIARTQQTQPTAPRSLAEGVAVRRVLLDRAERRRLAALNDLEFFSPPAPARNICVLPAQTSAAQLDRNRSLFVRDRATLDAAGADFSLRRTLAQIAQQASTVVPGTTAVSVFRQFWDTQAAPPGVTGGPHCTGTLNGFPIKCPRAEGQEAVGTDAQLLARMDEYKVLALVNRLDLAHKGWRNCGEHRIVYGKSGSGFSKNLIIFEAVLPNPRPGCREGCVPVAEFWKSLSVIDDGAQRAKQLEAFFYAGLPGFRPVVHVDHYSATGVSTSYGSSGSGQIRTNQFLEFQWSLREFKTVIDCGTSPCTFSTVPIMVKVNPHGTLWNEDNADVRAFNFRADTVGQLSRLASATMSGIGYEVDLAHDAGESVSHPGTVVDDYRLQMNLAAATAFRAALGAGSHTADQIANRALTQSCAGCHQPVTFGLHASGSIGTVTTPLGSSAATIDHWPAPVTAGFVHVDVPTAVQSELAANPAAFGTGMGQEISEALAGFFLPDRLNFLLGQLNANRCACRNRFVSLSADVRRRARGIEEKLDAQFAERFEALSRRIVEATAAPRTEARQGALEEWTRLQRERDAQLAAALTSAGIRLPEAAASQSPTRLNLRAGRQGGTPVEIARRRVAEVNALLRQEPPRRTVTGSFRPH